MDHTFPVTVVDDTGANVAGARVCVAKKSAVGDELHPYPSLAATHNDAGGGKYNESAAITPAADDWLLVVSLAGKAPVVQPFSLRAGKGGEFIAKATPSPVATVTITATVRKVGATKVKEINFHVTLHPAAEIVFFAGLDYDQATNISGGWLFHEYGFNRAEILRREKKIHAGTIVTVFSTAKIWRTTRVFGVRKWVDVEVAQLGDPSTRAAKLPADTYQPVDGLDIHITALYKYLHELGTRAPHSVKEFGIFSHSYPGGPIIYNTGERNAFRAFSSARDPKDFDARPKDFNNHNFAGYNKMPDSFAPGCRFTVWGCSATTHYKWRCRGALKAMKKGLAEDDFFIVNTTLEDSHHPAVGLYATEEERTSELRHRWDMDRRFRKLTYAAHAAARLGIEVRAGCPGTGSDPNGKDPPEMLMVDLTVYADVFEYFHKKFPKFKETNTRWDKGYVDYHALQSDPEVPKPPFSTQYYDLDVQTKITQWQTTTGAQLTFWNGKQIAHPTPNVKVVSKAMTDFVTVGKKGHLYILQDHDKTKSQAVFVQEDEKIFKVTQDASHKWTVIGAEI
ncbi:MAG TPA: hypothetical protein VGL72_17475 [Bryobacteraceae bacterium]|jgi:hypothetical protein